MPASSLIAAASKRLKSALADESGSALLELTLVVALLGMPMLLAVGEMGSLVYASAEIENAAHAGALYGSQSATFASDTAGMISAAQTEASDFGVLLVVTPLTYYACASAVGGTQYIGINAQANAKAACTGTNNHAVQFVQVSVTLQVTPLIRCPGLLTTITLNGSSVMEVQQS